MTDIVEKILKALAESAAGQKAVAPAPTGPPPPPTPTPAPTMKEGEIPTTKGVSVDKITKTADEVTER